MKKQDFLNECKRAIEMKKGIFVYVEIPGNEKLECISNVAEDVENKMKYYDGIYDDDMKHKHGPVAIKGVYAFPVMNDFEIEGIVK